MRVKQLWTIVPLPSNLRLMWDRITFSKLTTIYFLFSLGHCIVQLALQLQAFKINAEAGDFLSRIRAQSSLTYTGFPVLGDDLRFCEKVPSKIDASECKVIWAAKESTANNNSNEVVQSQTSLATASTSSFAEIPTSVVGISTTSLFSTSSSAASTFTLSATVLPSNSAIPSSTTPLSPSTTVSTTIETVIIRPGAQNLVPDRDDDDKLSVAPRSQKVKIMAVEEADGKWAVQLDGLGYKNESTRLSSSCIMALEWPILRLLNTKREDVVFVSFNVWVLGMSIVALLNESIPHIIASLLTHFLVTIWAAFQIEHTREFRGSFQRLITTGACSSSLPLLPNYWQARGQAELAGLILNAVALLGSGFLTWRLIKLFGWQTFKRVGASVKINRIYKIVLTFSITIQLSLFFMLVSLGLWIDQLFNGAIGRLAIHIEWYQALTVITIVLTLPWLATGWIASRKELRIPMYVFLGLSISYLATWAAMFMSDTFRWTFTQWVFFAVMNGAGVALTFLSFVFGIISRCNFGQGLSRHLEAAESLPGGDFEPAYPKDIEKVDFPSNDGPIPTFSVAFGSGNQVPRPNQMFVGSRGPRFYSQSSAPFESPRDSVASPKPAHTRAPSYDSLRSDTNLVRQGSVSSGYTDDKHGHMRWVIE